MTVGCTIQTHGPETSAASIYEDETVVLVIRAAVFVVFQLEVAILKLHLIRQERTVVGHFVDDGIDDTAFANEMPLQARCKNAAPGLERGGGGAIWGHSLVCWMPDALQVQ